MKVRIKDNGDIIDVEPFIKNGSYVGFKLKDSDNLFCYYDSVDILTDAELDALHDLELQAEGDECNIDMPPFRGDDHFFDLSGYFRARYPKEKEYQVKLAVNTALRKCFEELQLIGYLSEESPFAGHSWEFAFEELTGNPFLTGKKEQPISKIKREL